MSVKRSHTFESNEPLSLNDLNALGEILGHQVIKAEELESYHGVPVTKQIEEHLLKLFILSQSILIGSLALLLKDLSKLLNVHSLSASVELLENIEFKPHWQSHVFGRVYSVAIYVQVTLVYQVPHKLSLHLGRGIVQDMSLCSLEVVLDSK